MKNSEQYFKTVTGFIEGAKEVSAEYNKIVQRMESFKGSEGYDREIQAAEAKRDNAVSALRDSFRKSIQETTGLMREAAKNRPLVPPTPEQAALLNVLQMRKTVSRDELDRAARQLEGCPVALAALADLADKHKILGFRYEGERALADILDKIDTLERTALDLLREGLNFSARRVPKDVTYCLYYYGCFNPVPREGADTTYGVRSEDLVPPAKEINRFRAAVDG